MSQEAKTKSCAAYLEQQQAKHDLDSVEQEILKQDFNAGWDACDTEATRENKRLKSHIEQLLAELAEVQNKRE